MYFDVRVSSDFVISLKNYIREKYKLNNGSLETTRNIYTSMDRISFANVKFIVCKKSLMKNRIKNFNYYLTVKALNDKDTFLDFLEQFKDINVGLVFVAGKELDFIKSKFNCSELDKIIDCIMLTTAFNGKFYYITADFITTMFDSTEELWED